jgi:hypothetical protein
MQLRTHVGSSFVRAVGRNGKRRHEAVQSADSRGMLTRHIKIDEQFLTSNFFVLQAVVL